MVVVAALGGVGGTVVVVVMGGIVGVVGVLVKSRSNVCGRSRSSLAAAAGCSDRCCSGAFLCLQRVSGYYVRKATTAAIHFSHNTVHTRTYHSTPYRMSRGRTVSWLRRLVAGFPPLRPGDDPRLFCMDLVVDKWQWRRQGPLPVHRFSPVITSPVLHAHSFVCRRRCII